MLKQCKGGYKLIDFIKQYNNIAPLTIFIIKAAIQLKAAAITLTLISTLISILAITPNSTTPKFILLIVKNAFAKALLNLKKYYYNIKNKFYNKEY